MMAASDDRAGVNREIPGRKDILPAPFLGGVGIFPRQGIGEVDRAVPPSQILLMQRLDPSQMVLEQRGERGGKGRESVFVAFPRPDGELLHPIVDVLHPKSGRFHDAQAAPVEEISDQLSGSIHERKNSGDFLASHDHGNGSLLGGAHGIDTTR